MKYQKLWLISVVGILVAGGVFADEEWQDDVTKTRFLVLDGQKTSIEASKECKARGWDVFNYEYLEAEEQKRFLAATGLRNLSWAAKGKGPSEHEAATIWGTSQSTTIVTVGSITTAVSALEVKRYRDTSVPLAQVKWRNQTEDKASTVCMYQSHTWIGCAHEIRCGIERVSGGPIFYRTSIYEFGPHLGVVMARFRKRLAAFPSTGMSCELALRDAYCLDYRAL